MAYLWHIEISISDGGLVQSFLSNDSSELKDLLAIMETQETQIGLGRSPGEENGNPFA